MVLLVLSASVSLALISLLPVEIVGGFSVNTKLQDEKWQCESICASSGGKSEFIAKNRLCKCFLIGKHIDATDVALVNKRAKVFGINLETITLLSESEHRHNKREIATEITSTGVTNPPPITTQIPTTDVLREDNDGPIVGQQQRKPSYKSIVGQRKRVEPRPISPEQQKLIMQQMRDHLNRLGQLNDHRSRQTEVDQIRTILKQLQQTVVVSPQQRSRMATDRIRGLVQQSKLRTYRLRPLSEPKVGAEHTETNEVGFGKLKLKKQPDLEIITQNPDLVTEDDE